VSTSLRITPNSSTFFFTLFSIAPSSRALKRDGVFSTIQYNIYAVAMHAHACTTCLYIAYAYAYPTCFDKSKWHWDGLPIWALDIFLLTDWLTYLLMKTTKSVNFASRFVHHCTEHRCRYTARHRPQEDASLLLRWWFASCWCCLLHPNHWTTSLYNNETYTNHVSHSCKTYFMFFQFFYSSMF